LKLAPTGRKAGQESDVQKYSTEELFKMRKEMEESAKAKSSEYCVMLRKRSPKEFKDPTEFLAPVIDRAQNKREFFRQSSRKSPRSLRDPRAPRRPQG